MKATLSRRRMMVVSRDLAMMAIVTAGWQGCARPVSEHDKTDRQAPNDGLGISRVISVKGAVHSGDKPLGPGDNVQKSGSIKTAENSEVTLALPDQSILKLKARSKLVLNLDSRQGGELKLVNGGLLSVIRPRRNRPYIIKGASALVSVKGTICYMEVFDSISRESDSRIPQKATDYFCLCNGEIDFLEETKIPSINALRSTYHRALFAMPEGDRASLVDAGYLLNHSDEEILAMVDQMVSPKHATDWIARKGQSSGY